jgi:hypothetical protein
MKKGIIINIIKYNYRNIKLIIISNIKYNKIKYNNVWEMAAIYSRWL